MIKDLISIRLTGVGRSGTTYLKQILTYLNNIELQFALNSHHDYVEKSNGYILIPCRDLRDIMVSRWRIILSEENRYNEVEERLMTKEEIDRELEDNSTMIHQFRGIISTINNWGENAILLDYHKFLNNPKYILSKISNIVGKDLEYYVEELEEFSFSKNKKISEKYNNFLTWGGVGIHGHHCYKGEVGGWKKYIPNEYHDYVYNKLLLILKNHKEWKRFIQE